MSLTFYSIHFEFPCIELRILSCVQMVDLLIYSACSILYKSLPRLIPPNHANNLNKRCLLDLTRLGTMQQRVTHSQYKLLQSFECLFMAAHDAIYCVFIVWFYKTFSPNQVYSFSIENVFLLLNVSPNQTYNYCFSIETCSPFLTLNQARTLIDCLLCLCHL